MQEFYKVLDAQCWAVRHGKHCVTTFGGESLLMEKFGIHRELAHEIVQAWVWTKHFD